MKAQKNIRIRAFIILLYIFIRRKVPMRNEIELFEYKIKILTAYRIPLLIILIICVEVLLLRPPYKYFITSTKSINDIISF